MLAHAVALVALSLAAAPPSLHQATLALDDFKYDEALKLLPPEASIAQYSRDELIEWFSTRALTLLSLKREAEASAAFQKLFVFAPEWVLPDQFGPRVQTLVGQIRADAARNGVVGVKFEAGVLRATHDTLAVATALEVSWKAGNGPVEMKSLELLDEQAPPWPRSVAVDAWARVVGLNGSTLAKWGSEAAPTHFEPAVVSGLPPVAPAAQSPGLRAPAFIGIGALAAAAVSFAVALGFSAGSHDAEQALTSVMRDSNGRITSLTQRDAFALDARVKNDATTAGAFFVASGVLAAGGAALVLFERITATPTPGGVSLSLTFDSTFAVTRSAR